MDLQSFFRMSNVFNPQQQNSAKSTNMPLPRTPWGIPDEEVSVGAEPMADEEVTAFPRGSVTAEPVDQEVNVGPAMPQQPPRRPTVPTNFGSPFGPPKVDEEVTVGPEPMVDEEVTVGAQQPSTMEAFRQNVLNPPQRQHMTYPKGTNAGLIEALKIAATPTDYEKNRVYVNGVAHQKQKVHIDPVTGEKKFITDVKQPGFMEQVMKAMPASVSAGVDILNQPREDAVEDWKMQNEGYKQAAAAESQMALADYRGAQTNAVPINAASRATQAGAAMMNAESRAHLARLNTMTDVEKQQMVQSGKMTLAEYNASEAMKRVELGQAGANDRAILQSFTAQRVQSMRGQQAEKQISLREQAQGRLQAKQSGYTTEHIAARGKLEADLARLRGDEARKTKSSPGWITPTEANKKAGLQDRVSQITNANPGLAAGITFNEQGYPVLDPSKFEDEQQYADMYEYIYGEDIDEPVRETDVGMPPVPPAPTSTVAPRPQAPAAPPQAAAPIAGAVDPQTRTNANIQQAATDFLRQNGLPVTPKNIEHAIKTGRVR